jgi:hypothetical protein
MQLTKILLPVTALSISLGFFACSSTVSPSEGSDDAIASEEDGLEPFIPGFDPGKYSSKTDEPSSSASDVTSSESEGQSATSGEESSESGTESASSGDDSSASKGDGSSTSGEESTARVGGDSSASGDEGSVSGDESSSSTGEVSSASGEKVDFSGSQITPDGNGNATITEEFMKGVTDQDVLDDLDKIANGETVDGYEESDQLNFKVDDFDFDNYDYFCFTGEQSWLKITQDQLKESGLPFLWNGKAYGLRKKYTLRFEDTCDAIYVKRITD